MKKFIYASIALVTLSLISCRNQEDMVQLNDIKPTEVSKNAAPQNSASSYSNFDSSAVEQGDPTRPPRD